MGFLDKIFKPKWKHEDWRVRIEAVEKLTDQKILFNIAKNDESKHVRKAAVEKIKDEDVLIDIAKSDANDEVRKIAVEKIKDEDVLIDIAKNDENKYVRSRATLKYKNKHIDEIFNSSNFYNDSLKEFERNNSVTFSIYDLENHDGLMCDNIGHIYTVWNNENIYFENGYLSGSSIKSRPVIEHEYNSIKYISEDFSNRKNIEKRKYQYSSTRISIENVQDPATDYWVDSITTRSKFSRLEAIVIIGITDKITDLSEMFYGCQAETISFANCDFSNVKNTYDIFSGCNNLKTIYADEISIHSLFKHVPESIKYLDTFPKFSESEILDMLNDESIRSRKFAIERINDEKILIETLQKDESPEVRWEAIKKINDESTLSNVAKNNPDCDFRKVAVKKISDESILVDIAKNDEDWSVRKAAVENISDESVLADIAKNDPVWYVRKGAVENISDESVLADIAKNDPDIYVGSIDINNISNDAVLADIAKYDSDYENRMKANIKRGRLPYIIKRSTRYWKEVFEKISEESVLADIAKNDPDSYIREAAEERLKQLGYE